MSEITTYYLEMKSPSSLKAKDPVPGLDIRECLIKQGKFNRFLYQLVGEPWQWIGKLPWTDEQWKEFAEADNLRTWVAYHKDSPAGYYELQKQDGENVEISYFGLAPKFIGKGFGGYLLTHAIKSAWNWDKTERVWVHTCSNDHPGALNNYRARGFEVYKETVK